MESLGKLENQAQSLNSYHHSQNHSINGVWWGHHCPLDVTPHTVDTIRLPSPEDLPYPGIKPGSSALQTDSLPTELSREAHGSSKVEANLDWSLFALFPSCSNIEY